jgi:hypothetical protein
MATKHVRGRVRGGRLYQYNPLGDLVDTFGRADSGDISRFRKRLRRFVEDDEAWRLIVECQKLRQQKNSLADELNRRINVIQKTVPFTRARKR